MGRMTIDERLREAQREVAEAFRVPLTRVESVTERLERQALEQLFGDDPRTPIAEELAREMRHEVLAGLEKLRGEDDGSTMVIDFPQEARRSQG